MLIPRDYQKESAEKAISHMRKTNEPGVLVLTTAAGKSVVTTEVARVVASAGKRVLCLAPNGDLVSESAKKFKMAGGSCSVFSASLGMKDVGHPVVFGTPGSVVRSLSRFDDEYALLLIDECATVSEEESSMYQRIIRHMSGVNPNLRILGLDAVPVRGKHELIGPDKTFKHVIHELPHHVLAELGWVVPYRLGMTEQHYDLGKLRLTDKNLSQKIDDETLNKERLTKSILRDVWRKMAADGRKCAIIFASSVRHAQEIVSYLPSEMVALVTGETPKGERRDTIEDAREGKYKFLVTVNALSVGTDIPIIDTLVFMRATESVRLLLQAMGRGCRLHDPAFPGHGSELNWKHPGYTGKTSALVLDYGQNVDRFELDDSATIAGLVAEKNKQDDEEYFIVECPDCNAENRHTAHRCVGVLHDETRCEYRFVFKECESCQTQNSLSARHCRKCDAELIDPNDRLTPVASVAAGEPRYVGVIAMDIKRRTANGRELLMASYMVDDGGKNHWVNEFLDPSATSARGRQKFEDFTRETGAMGNTIQNIILEKRQLKKPSQLNIRKPKGKKTYEVISRRYISAMGW